MWNIANRDIIVLVSVISGCAIVCKVWGSFFALTITLVLIICAWCTYIVADDTPFTPHALLALDYLEQAGRELNSLLEKSYRQIFGYSARLRNILLYLYETHVVERMAQRRRSSYQLSAETYTNSRSTSRFNLVDGLSPIARSSYRPLSGSNVENSPYSESDSRIFERVSSLGQVTSTPLVSWKKEGTRNGNTFGSDPSGINKIPWRNSQSVSQNHTLSRGEDITYSTEGSPWGTSISPKMRARAGGVKTVQTVAGPLLASTRYNIDPKVYSDVTSAGLTTRLAKYATEANMKLIHQPQYGTGQFPRVNLNSSPVPLMSMKAGKIRTPVTVRVAPPENTRYSSPERQQILSNICHVEGKAQPSVVQVLREISLKRHASHEDVTFDLPKKQRTEAVFSDGLENLEEMTQKRSRDESSRSEEEISPQNKAIRPAKRTKMPSCYDILSSLSSSISSGVKRKAVDVSRSGTPDVGKHFKSLDTSHGDGIGTSPLSRSISEPMKPNKRMLNQPLRNTELQSTHTKSVELIPQKGILTTSPGKETLDNAGGDMRDRNRDAPRHDSTIVRERGTKLPSPSDKLTDKLFMKAEPQNIDKLKTLIEEHGNITPKFTTNDTDEIKKSDIVNMRQTSMKTRLKSMFDAISGKATSKINPEVVIQAEEPKVSSSQPIVASLNSSTSTTNVNTSPIATSAIVPIIGKTKLNTTAMKHVTFQFTSAETPLNPSIVETTKATIAETKTTSSSNTSQEPKKVDNPVVEKSASSIFNTPVSSSATSMFTPSSAPAFSIGSPTFAMSSSISTNLTPTTITKSSTTTSLSTKLVTTPTISSSQFNSPQLFNVPSTSSSLFGISSPVIAKSVSNPPQSTNSAVQSPEKTGPTPTVNFSFGTLANTNSATPKSIQSPVLSTAQTVTTSASVPITTVSSGLFGFGAVTKPVQSDSATNAFNPPASTTFSFGSNVAVPQTTEKKTFTFGTTTASSNETTGIISTITSQSVPASVAATTESGFKFSSASNTPTTTNLFGAPTTTSSIPSSGFLPSTSAQAVFTFGTNLNSTTTAKPGFSFGANPTTTATAATSASTVPTLSFGNTNNAAISTFGGSSTTAPSTSVTTQPSIFGAPVTSATGFATSTNPPAFGTIGSQSATFAPSSGTTSTFGTPKTMETPVFGTNPSGLPSFPNTSTTSGIFSGVNTEVTTTSALPAFGTSTFGQTKPSPAFGTAATPSFGSAGSSSLFGAPPTTTVAFGASNTSSATPIFGAPSTVTPSFGTSSTPALGFGNANTAAPSFGTQSTPASSFGTQNAPVLSFGTPTTAPPAFGATNSSTTSFGTVSTAAPAFGTINTTTATFGAQNSAAGTIGNPIATSSTFSATSSAFGVATKAPPAFPTSLSAPGAFGTPSTSGFGNVATPSNPPPAFNSVTPSFSGFSGTSNVASPFSTPPASSSSNYNALNTGNSSFGGNVNTGNTSFTFNSSQVPVQQPQQNAVFAFGSGAAAPASNVVGGSSPFQFSSVTPQPAGFNFTGAPSTPAINFSKDGTTGNSFNLPAAGTNTFNAPTTGGMFSIGTGSTAPRARPSRRRQR